MYRSIDDWCGDELEDWVAFDLSMMQLRRWTYKILYT